MRKLVLVFVTVCLLAGCGKRATTTAEQNGNPALQAPAPIRLEPDEVEFWQRLMERDFQRSGVYHPDRAALLVDQIIMELRKRKK